MIKIVYSQPLSRCGAKLVRPGISGVTACPGVRAFAGSAWRWIVQPNVFQRSPEQMPGTGAPDGLERRHHLRGHDGTKPIDLTYLARFTLGNVALEAEVLDLFITHAPRTLADLRAAGTAKAWHDAAHTLKGSARGVGAWRIGRAAEMAERLRFDTDLDRRAFALDSLTEALAEAITYVQSLHLTR